MYINFFEKSKGKLTLGAPKRQREGKEISSRKWDRFIWLRMRSTGWLGSFEHGNGHSNSMFGEE